MVTVSWSWRKFPKCAPQIYFTSVKLKIITWLSNLRGRCAHPHPPHPLPPSLSLSVLLFTGIQSYIKLRGKKISREKDLWSRLGIQLGTSRTECQSHKITASVSSVALFHRPKWRFPYPSYTSTSKIITLSGGRLCTGYHFLVKREKGAPFGRRAPLIIELYRAL